MEAKVIFADETHVIVICPYCLNFHKHGSAPGASWRSSHCQQGEYKFGEVIIAKTLMQVLERRDKQLSQMRLKREKKKESQSLPEQ